jgi:mitochondrial ATPase complex subunit ATP10
VRDYRNIANAAQGGKFYVANTALYKANAAMYWPNLMGRTLRGDKANTTDLLSGWVSVVCFFQRNWGFEQTRSFVGAKGNPELAAVLEANKDTVQALDVTMEDLQTFTVLKRFFEFNLRRQKSAEEQDRYFITEGIPVGVKESIGVMNSAIGYVFLVDQNCKIRWSACATALPEEKESFLKGLQSLIRQAKEKIS